MADTERDLTVETAEAAPIDAAKGAEIMEKFEKESRTRNFSFQPLVKAGYVLCLLFTVYHLIFASGMVSTQNIKHHAVHVGMVLVLGFLFYPALKKSSRKKVAWYDWICIALSVAMPCYVFYRYMAWTSTGFRPTTLDIIMGTLLILLVMECSRRISGPALTILSAIFLIYGMYGRYFPGIFQHRGYTWTRMVQYLTCDISGIYGSSVKVSATFIVLFIIFGEVMNKCGMGQFFNDIANSLAGHTKGGPAKVAVLASGFLGSINGSAVANVVTTGTFTIPLMKKIGFDKDTAGAVEAVASGGGQIMPPVMGSVAFIMSEVTGIAYGQIALAALVPAVLYYLTLSSSVLVYSWKYNVSAADMEIKKPGEILKSGWYYLIPLAVLIGLMILGKSAQRCALWAALTAIAVGVLFRRERLSRENISKKLVGTARGMATISAACLLAGIITGCINITGFGLKVSGIIELISGGSLLLMLVLTMVVCLILGMGLPTSASYVVLSVLVAPVIIKMGVAKLAVHLFILHFGSIATLTPPVALAVFAACGISGGTLWRTGGQAMKLAAAGLIVPFVFVYNNELLLMGEPGMIFFAIGTALLGCVLLSLAIIGWLFRDLGRLQRLAFLACGIALILPRPLWANAAGLLAGGLLVLWNWNRRAINQKQKGETL